MDYRKVVKYILIFLGALAVIVLLSVVVLKPLSAVMLYHHIPVVHFLGWVFQTIHYMVIRLPFEVIGPWLFHFMTGMAAESIPVWLNIVCFPFICFGMLALFIICGIGIASYRGPYYY